MNTFLQKIKSSLKASVLLILMGLTVGIFSLSQLVALAQNAPAYDSTLAVDKTVVRPGEEFLYTVTVTNTGAQDITNIIAHVNLSDKVSYIPGTSTAEKGNTRVSFDDNWVATHANLGTLTPNEKVFLRFSVRTSNDVQVDQEITSISQVKIDGSDWQQDTETVKVVSVDERAVLEAGNFMKVANITQGGNGWQDETVNADQGNVIEYLVLVRNSGQHPARNVTIKANLPGRDQIGTQLRPTVTLSSDNADSISDGVNVNVSGPAYLEIKTGHAKLGGVTDLFNCPNECDFPESLYHTPVNMGTVDPGELIQIKFKSDLRFIVSSTPTPTPTPTATPSPTPTATPTPTPTATPSPTPTATPTPTSKFLICKFEDTNGDGDRDSGEAGLSWEFEYSVANGDVQSYRTHAGWWRIFSANKGCGDEITVPLGAAIWIKEKSQNDWVATTPAEIRFLASTTPNEVVVKTFGNKRVPGSTPTPTPTPGPKVCNQECSVDSECGNNLICYPEGDKKYCRHKDKPTASTCDTRDMGGFRIRKYHDLNGDGHQQDGEKGLSWTFEWDQNKDGSYKGYETFEKDNGEGGVVYLPVGTVVRIKEKSKSGWSATTPTESEITIRKDDVQLMVYGNWQGKPKVLGSTTTVTTAPKTGFEIYGGVLTSVLSAGVGLYLRKKGL